jgi:hypothetical protein
MPNETSKVWSRQCSFLRLLIGMTEGHTFHDGQADGADFVDDNTDSLDTLAWTF